MTDLIIVSALRKLAEEMYTLVSNARHIHGIAVPVGCLSHLLPVSIRILRQTENRLLKGVTRAASNIKSDADQT